jgi:hypothetical protein
MRIMATVLCTLALAAAEVRADDVPDEPAQTQASPVPASRPQKEGYTLFNPTPETLLRALNTDRPSVTEGPFTVDAGHFQWEMSLVEYTYDYDHGTRTDGYNVAPFNLRVGLLNDVELDLILNPYQNIYTRSQTISTHLAGIGDTQLRMKINLWGNDGGVTAFGLLPFVNFPTGYDGLSNHHVEAGLILPFAIQLPAGFGLGTMAEYDLHRNTANDGYGVDFVHSVTLGKEITEQLNIYIEYVGIAPIQTGNTYLAYFNTGVTYLLTQNIEVDMGINIGLSAHANDFTVFTGLSFRI